MAVRGHEGSAPPVTAGAGWAVLSEDQAWQGRPLAEGTRGEAWEAGLEQGMSMGNKRTPGSGGWGRPSKWGVHCTFWPPSRSGPACSAQGAQPTMAEGRECGSWGFCPGDGGRPLTCRPEWLQRGCIGTGRTMGQGQPQQRRTRENDHAAQGLSTGRPPGARPCPQAASLNGTPDEARARGDRGCLGPGQNQQRGRNEERLALGPRGVPGGHFSNTAQGPEGTGGHLPHAPCRLL